MNVVLDASVAVAWLVEQAQSPAARRLRERHRPEDVEFAVPSLFMAEVSSAILKATRRRHLAPQDAMEAANRADRVAL